MSTLSYPLNIYGKYCSRLHEQGTRYSAHLGQHNPPHGAARRERIIRQTPTLHRWRGIPAVLLQAAQRRAGLQGAQRRSGPLRGLPALPGRRPYLAP